MEVASKNEMFREFALALLAQPPSVAASEARRRTYMLLSIIGLASVIRLYGISLYPLVIDEYGTILEANSVGLNWNSIIYSSLMHFWIRFGTNEFWLRLPAAIFGIATVAVLFKIGAKLGGWRAGITAALLAATSPFNIYHSQEARFYSLFMLAAAAFMLATISYIDSPKSARGRFSVISTGALLVVSHFLGAIALYAQGVAAFLAAKKRRKLTILALTCGPALLIFGLPILTPIRNLLLYLYQTYGNAGNANLSATSVSLVSFVKMAFAGYVLIFGYHVYPLRLALVIPGLGVSAFLLARGVLRLSKERRWILLPLTYLVAVVGIYLVLDSLGGRVAAGVSPRHVAFVWPAFVVLLALGLSSFTRMPFQLLLAVMLFINSLSLWFGWQKDWTYGSATDYRTAGAYVSSWADKDAAMIVDGRAAEAAPHYFPQSVPQFIVGPRSTEFDQLSYRRLILVTNDWNTRARQRYDELISDLAHDFTIVDGRVEYPLFQYVLERKSALSNPSNVIGTGQLHQPFSVYGLEFQDLKLPVTVNVSNVLLKVIGAYALPDSAGSSNLVIPVSHPIRTSKFILLTNVVGSSQTPAGTPIAEVILENQRGMTLTIPLRMNQETASWRDTCGASAACSTVFQWHKRVAITNQNSFPDAWRDFQAGMHGATFDLPAGTEVKNFSVRYLARSGQLYIWAIAFPSQ